MQQRVPEHQPTVSILAVPSAVWCVAAGLVQGFHERWAIVIVVTVVSIAWR
jgi:hypothetical protein